MKQARYILLDSALIVLLVIGLTDEALLLRHKKIVGSFTRQHYGFLKDLIAVSRGIIFTPQTLAEASNHLEQIRDAFKSLIFERFRSLIKQVDELTSTSAVTCESPEFVSLGMTDSTLLSLLSNDYVLLTTDDDLWSAALRARKDALNFKHEARNNGVLLGDISG